jgi:hypothetical protein
VLKIPDNIVDLLKRYKTWQDKCRAEVGNKWKDHDRLFTQWNGSPMDIGFSQRTHDSRIDHYIPGSLFGCAEPPYFTSLSGVSVLYYRKLCKSSL